MRYFIVSVIILFFGGSWLWFRSFISRITSPETSTPITTPITDPITEAKKFQEDFCANFQKYENKSIEELIRLKKINIYGNKFEMYVYKKNDIVSDVIYRTGGWEMSEIKELTNAASSVFTKRKIADASKITILDIGAQIGWFTFMLAAKGYSVVAIEPMKENAYMLRKSQCIHPYKENIVIIEKALGEKTSVCLVDTPLDNMGDPSLRCEDIANYTNATVYNQLVDVIKLDDLEPFLKDIGAIKMDIEGFEYRALQGGRKVFLDMHVPFILAEFSLHMMADHGSDGKKFLEEFVNAGYNISLTGFGKKDASIEDILKHNKKVLINNAFFTYAKEP